MALTTPQTASMAPSEASIPDVPIYRLSVPQYRAMAEAGILGEDDPVELLEGWLVPKMTKFPPHTLASGLLQDALTLVLPRGWYLKVQDPIDTPDSAPEPDLCVVRGTRRDGRGTSPRSPGFRPRGRSCGEQPEPGPGSEEAPLRTRGGSGLLDRQPRGMDGSRCIPDPTGPVDGIRTIDSSETTVPMRACPWFWIATWSAL